MRARILKTADELGYRVNRNARRLARGVSGLVAVVVPDITNPYFPPIVAELGRLLEARGSSMLMVNTSDDAARELAVIRRLVGDVDGFVLIAPRANLRSLQSELWQSRAVLVHRPARSLNHVLVDESQAVRELFGHLRSGGHDAVGYLGGPSDSWVNGRRGALARASAASAGIRLVDLGAHPATLVAGEAAAGTTLDAGVSAVVAFDDTLALGLMSALTTRGVRIPGDLAIASFDDLSYSVLVRPAITSIAADPSELAAAAQRMLEAASTGQLESASASVPAVLHLRASIGPVVALDSRDGTL